MRINNNLMAMNTHRQLGINSTNGAKSIEKLSSGFRINRAGDDAAGLAISEKMRAQVRGLNQASRNSQDGISMIQTAEGALNETQAILQRMRELAVQSANGVNKEEDRSALQNEVTQLKSEIDRIAETTEFNKKSLLKGDGGVELKDTGLVTTAKLTGGVAATTIEERRVFSATASGAAGDTFSINLNGETLTMTWAADNTSITDASAYNTTANNTTIDLGTAASHTSGNTAAAIANGLNAMIAANDTLKGNYKVTVSAEQVTIEAVKGGAFEGSKGGVGDYTAVGFTTANNTLTNGTDVPAVKSSGSIDFTALQGADKAATDTNIKNLVGDGITLGDTQIEFYNSNDGAYTGDAVGVDISSALASSLTAEESADQLVASIVAQTGKVDGLDLAVNGADNQILDVVAKTGGVAGNDIEVKDGATVNEEFNATFQIGANESQTMEVTMNDMRSAALKITDVDISKSEDAQKAITTIDVALSKVSDERSKLGAFQNRLEHTIKNLDTSSENLQASESRIRDVDMAKEMMNFTKNNILQQAAQSMLAQANQAPQGVLQLLR